MGLSTAMTTAATGLISHQTALDTISNNIANVNTTSYKSSVYSFSTLLDETISASTSSTSSVSIGLGTQTAAITTDTSQGSLEETDIATDMAISGNGYFILSDGSDYYYTRDGSFTIGSDGALLSADGLYVQGVMADEDGNLPDTVTTVENIYIALGQTGGASETTTASFTGNLDSGMDLAEGINIVGADVTDADVLSALGDTTTDSSWDALNTTTDGVINGGSVLTSSTLASYDATSDTYSAASSSTDLADLCYESSGSWVQPFAGISDGDEITVTYEKNDTTYTATYTYNSSTSTLEDFMTFLSGDYDNCASATSVDELEGDANTSTQGGILGCVDVAATDDSPVETAGAYGRTFTGEADYDGDGTYSEDAYAVSIVSNLGDDNSITSLSFSYNDVTYDDMFTSDTDYGSTESGGSVTTEITVYDSQGNETSATVTLTKVSEDSGTTTYRWVATSTDDTDAAYAVDDNGNIITSTVIGTGTVTFDSNGDYVSSTSETDGITIDLSTSDINITTDELDFSSLTQVATDSTLALEDQDGSAAGSLESFTVSEDGVIQGVYSNGTVETIARICVATVASDTGLESVGNNLYVTSSSSGDATISYANEDGSGAIMSGYLESSNVDLGTELTTMISVQRGYEINARVITTADEMLQNLVNLGR